jgi:hypothetical protein
MTVDAMGSVQSSTQASDGSGPDLAPRAGNYGTLPIICRAETRSGPTRRASGSTPDATLPLDVHCRIRERSADTS